MFGRLFKKKAEAKRVKAKPVFLTAQLNARLRPLDRGDLFEDPLDEAMREMGLGGTSGGGTLLSETGEVEYCDVEIEARDAEPATLEWIVGLLEKLGAPKGSLLRVFSDQQLKQEIPFGTTEGLAIYLNGSDLPQEVYETGDVNFVWSEFNRLLDVEGRVFSYREGPTETALYLYGRSFEEMHRRIADFVASYPLCQKCRIERIA